MTYATKAEQLLLQGPEVQDQFHAVTWTIPSDPLFGQQWHLRNTGQGGGTVGIDVNATEVWDDYDGSRVLVGVFDDSVQHSHPDLNDNYNTTIDWDGRDNDGDPSPVQSDDNHGTSVAGIIAAEADNGLGGCGVAHGATLAGFRGLGSLANFQRQSNVDVSNNSWGYTARYDDDVTSSLSYWTSRFNAFESAADNGRGGLGTVWAWAAGNGRTAGHDVNDHNFQNPRFSIAVAAIDNDGTYSSYSTPGAALLVSAPGSPLSGTIVTTDRTGSAGYDSGDYTFSFNGTSAATPMVSGVAALVLDANPDLGYRDVQEILAYSARQNHPGSSGWDFNGAGDWNGGGLHVSHDYGFGLVDAHAAVRLAETWTKQSTHANEDQLSYSRSPGTAIPDNSSAGATSWIDVPGQLDIQHVEVYLNIAHTWRGDLSATLTSPDGTVSQLVDRPGRYQSGFGDSSNNIRFTTSSTHHWGEDSAGRWTLKVTDHASGDTGTLHGWTLRFYGDTPSSNDTYVYTNAFSSFGAGSPRRTLNDSGGTDTLNAAAATADADLDLAPGTTSSVAGGDLTITAGTLIETAYTGDGDDTIRGNAVANSLYSGRGNDHLIGRGGADRLFGESGGDRLEGYAGNDRLFGEGGGDELFGGGGADRLFGNAGADRLLGEAGNDRLEGGSGADVLDGGLGVDRLYGQGQVDTLYGGAGGDSLYGGNGADSLFGGNGADRLQGDGGADRLFGQAGSDQLFGRAGADRLSGGGGVDYLYGESGDDRLVGQDGDDQLIGGLGDDLFVFANGDDADDLTGFVTGAGSEDVIDLSGHSAVSDFAGVQAAASQVGPDTVIDLGGGDSLTLLGVTVGSLHQDDFQF